MSEAERQLALGGQAWAAGRPADAAAHFAAAARLDPRSASAHGNLGVALRRLGHPEAAAASTRRALALNPDDPGLLSNLGNALRETGHFADAEAVMRRAVALAPGNRSFAFNLALLLRDRRQHLEALAMMEALAVQWPENGELAWDLALTQLYLCDWSQGWPGYENRFRLARSPARDLPGRRWDGAEDVAGKTLFLHAEQGFGDALQFVRFVPLAAARGARVVLESQPELAELFAALPGVAAVVPRGGPPPAYDLWAPMLSLPALLGIGGDFLATPYLTAPARPSRVGRPPGSRLAAGLVWAGKTTPRDRSWPLEDLLPLLADPGIAWHSLQLGPRRADLDRLGVRHLVTDLAPELNSFADTAAAMAELDLVVTIDTSAAHMAGALGRPTFVLLRTVSDWRWRDEPADSAWYPTMRLFRQPDPFDFKTPVAELAAALADFRSSRH